MTILESRAHLLESLICIGHLRYTSSEHWDFDQLSVSYCLFYRVVTNHKLSATKFVEILVDLLSCKTAFPSVVRMQF